MSEKDFASKTDSPKDNRQALLERVVGPPAADDVKAQTINVVRALAMDAVEAAGSGHPGTAMSLAPAAYLLYQDLMRHDPSDPQWVGRDRFVLSVGHSSLTLYIQLYLSGYGLTLDDIAAYRQWGSLTPGHPEYGHTAGVETTTGPLGQGISTAVGMAAAARYERGLFDPDAPEGESPFDHTIWCIAGDGCLEEGVSGEASSWAGHQRLGNLVVLYDDNHISIEGDTDVAFSEDVLARYAAYGWHTELVLDSEDTDALAKALTQAQAITDRPSIVAMHSVIGWPSPNKRNSGSAHGSALGADEVRETKELLGLSTANFVVPDAVLAHTRTRVERGQAAHRAWDETFHDWAAREPERAALFNRLAARKLPDGWANAIPTFEPSAKGMAMRAASGDVLTALKDVLPELWGGSADLASSNNTTMKGADSFLPVESGAKDANPYGRTLHFGIREHAMGSILNGIAAHGPTLPYGGTFLVFSDYMRGAVRVAAIMKVPVTYVWTHDSIGLGGDGPTHQPIEHLASLRAMPGLSVVRPADANETAVVWRTTIERHTARGPLGGPVALALSRQNAETLDRTVYASAEGAAKGGYTLIDASAGLPEIILIATGTEVGLALKARDTLEAAGTPTRVVSLPCWEWFAEQEPAYRQEVLPPNVKARVSVEAGATFGWHSFVGDEGVALGIDHFGASAPEDVLYEQYGITPDRIVAAAHEALSKARKASGTTTGN